MRCTNLILLEGIPGSGKSTTAHQLTRQLQRHGIAASWFGEKDIAHPTSAPFHNVDQFVHDTQDRWNAFISSISGTAQTVILEGNIFQRFLRLLLQHNVDWQYIRMHIAALTALAMHTNPVFIFFYQPDVRGSLENIAAYRGVQWTKGSIQRFTNTPYALSHHLVGFDGLVAFWKAYQDCCNILFHASIMPRLWISLRAVDEGSHMPIIYSLLEIEPYPENRLPAHELETFVGIYHDPVSLHNLRVRVQSGDLFVDNFIWNTVRLIHNGDGSFDIEGLNYTIAFLSDDMGNIRYAHIGGRDVDFLHIVGHTLYRTSRSVTEEMGDQTYDMYYDLL